MLGGHTYDEPVTTERNKVTTFIANYMALPAVGAAVLATIACHLSRVGEKRRACGIAAEQNKKLLKILGGIELISAATTAAALGCYLKERFLYRVLESDIKFPMDDKLAYQNQLPMGEERTQTSSAAIPFAARFFAEVDGGEEIKIEWVDANFLDKNIDDKVERKTKTITAKQAKKFLESYSDCVSNMEYFQKEVCRSYRRSSITLNEFCASAMANAAKSIYKALGEEIPRELKSFNAREYSIFPPLRKIPYIIHEFGPLATELARIALKNCDGKLKHVANYLKLKPWKMPEVYLATEPENMNNIHITVTYTVTHYYYY
ncbi:hypothetical protein HOD08_02810 [bacterium]|nr:hypothetical protein [bacterium]